MASYLVLEPPEAASDGAEKAALIRDGFSLPAFILPLIWFLWHRMWIEALTVLVFGVALALLDARLGGALPVSILSILFSFLIGLEAAALRAAALERRGWRPWGVIEARRREEAELRYASEAGRPEPARGAAPTAMPRPFQPPKAVGPAVGLLDYPRTR